MCIIPNKKELIKYKKQIKKQFYLQMYIKNK